MNWVNFLDLTTNEVKRMPESDLSPGMVPAKMDGREDVYWVESKHLRQGIIYYHPPFQGELATKISEIQRVFYGLRGMSYAEWEDGFRRDMHPEKEIDLWLWAARKFQKAIDSGFSSEAEQWDVYTIVLNLITVGNKPDLICQELKTLTREQALQVMEAEVDDLPKPELNRRWK